MAEISEEQLEPAHHGEIPESALEEGIPRKPDETEKDYLARAGAKPEEKGLLEKAAEFLKPETVTGAAAAGVHKGATLGFGDEINGLIHAKSDVDEQQATNVAALEDQKRLDADALVEAARHGSDAVKAEHTRQGAASAPQIPGITSYQLKREGQPDAAVIREAKTAPVELDTPAVGSWSDAYRGARDSMRDQYKKAEQAHPVAFGAGEFAGGMAVPLPGAGKAKGLAKVGKYALTGAGVGGINALGNSEADLTQGEPGAFGRAAAETGAGMGAGALIGGVLGGAAAKLDPWLEQKAGRAAFKSLDPYMESIRKELGPDATKGEILAEAERLGHRVLDEGIIPKTTEGVPFDVTTPTRWANSESLAERALAKAEEAGQLKSGFVDSAQDQLAKAGTPTPVSIGRLATQIEQQAHEAAINGNQKLARKLSREAADLRKTVVDRASAGFTDPAAQTLQDAEKFKTGLQKQIDYGAKLPSREAQTVVARLAKEQAENAIEKGLGPDERELFKAVKDRYGDLKSISNIANHGAVRGFRNNVVGIGDKMAAGVGAAAGAGGPAAIPAALAAAGAHHFANHRGVAGLARTLDNAAKRTSPLVTPAIEQAEEKAKSLWYEPAPSSGDEADEHKPWQTLKGGR